MNDSKLNSMTCTGIGFILASVVGVFMYLYYYSSTTQARAAFFATVAIANAFVLGVMAIIIGWYFVNDEKEKEVR